MIRSTIHDISSSIIRHKMRSVLTGFGVGWGIFILVILLGVSKGTEAGIKTLLEGFAQNSIWFYGGQSKLTGEQPKQILFDKQQLIDLKNVLGGALKEISPESNLNEYGMVVQGDKSMHCQVKAVTNQYFNIKLLNIKDGRLLNPKDIDERRRVVVIGQQVRDGLFKKGEKVIGKYISIGEVQFKVIGILKSGTLSDQSEQGSIFIPISTTESTMNKGEKFAVFGLTLKKDIDVKQAEERIRHYLAKQVGFDYKKKEALFVFNFEEQSEIFDKLFQGLNIFFWFIGICLLLSGIIGVTNIMLVVVAERTKEIGIRKAIGAHPRIIISMILIESTGITLVAGIIGIAFGYVALKIIDLYLKGEAFLIKETQIDLTVTGGALLILILSGMIAGIVPATKAMKIRPIKAIQIE